MEHLSPTYTLFAMPSLFAKGPFTGELKGITFLAISPNKTVRWFALNVGQFDNLFSELLSHGIAQQLMSSLRRGRGIQFPGEYRPDQFASGFQSVSPLDSAAHYACLQEHTL